MLDTHSAAPTHAGTAPKPHGGVVLGGSLRVDTPKGAIKPNQPEASAGAGDGGDDGGEEAEEGELEPGERAASPEEADELAGSKGKPILDWPFCCIAHILIHACNTHTSLHVMALTCVIVCDGCLQVSQPISSSLQQRCASLQTLVNRTYSRRSWRGSCICSTRGHSGLCSAVQHHASDSFCIEAKKRLASNSSPTRQRVVAVSVSTNHMQSTPAVVGLLWAQADTVFAGSKQPEAMNPTASAVTEHQANVGTALPASQPLPTRAPTASPQVTVSFMTLL